MDALEISTWVISIAALIIAVIALVRVVRGGRCG